MMVPAPDTIAAIATPSGRGGVGIIRVSGPAARAAARSLSGMFSREIDALVDALIELRMFTEATLDFPEEDIELLRTGDAQGKLMAIRAHLTEIFVRARQGALLRDGLAVVL